MKSLWFLVNRMQRIPTWLTMLLTLAVAIALTLVMREVPESRLKTATFTALVFGVMTSFAMFVLIHSPVRVQVRVYGFVLKFQRKSSRLTRPPGFRLARFLSFVLTKKTYERLVVQLILDEREEHAEALAHSMKWKARFISCRLWVLVFASLIAAACASTVSKLFPRSPSL